MSEFTPDTGEVRDSLVFLNKHYAKQHGDVDLLVVGSETAAQFDRMIAEVERAAAEKAYEQGRLDERHDCTLTTAHLELPPEKRSQEELRKNLRSNNPYRDFEQRVGGDTK